MPNELRAIIAHELTHGGKQAPFLKQATEMNWCFGAKGRFKEPEFEKRYSKAFENFRIKSELDADDASISLYGAETLISAKVKLMVASCEQAPEMKALILAEEEMNAKGRSLLFQDAITNPDVQQPLDAVRKKLQKMLSGEAVCADLTINAMFQNLGKARSR